jgi:tRNA(Ile2) C34 agmatinyltransferase TiaS
MTEATVFDCALCGNRFTHGDLVCGACILSAGCQVVRCPRCGYQFPRDSTLVAWVRRLFRPRARKELL